MLVPEKYTFIFVALNLLILFFFMKKFLFKPVTEFMENRKNSIDQALKDADQAKLEVAEQRKNYEEQIKKIREESDKLINEARVKATREYDDIIANAKKDALAIVEKGRQDVERERAEMLRQVRQQIAMLAISAATKVVEANMDTASNKSMVDKFIDEAGAA
jgi:F-type H+-transporting ATPase subunit b